MYGQCHCKNIKRWRAIILLRRGDYNDTSIRHRIFGDAEIGVLSRSATPAADCGVRAPARRGVGALYAVRASLSALSPNQKRGRLHRQVCGRRAGGAYRKIFSSSPRAEIPERIGHEDNHETSILHIEPISSHAATQPSSPEAEAPPYARLK